MRLDRNPAFESELRAEPGFERVLHDAGAEVLHHAELIAPRGPSGFYHKSLGLIRVAGSWVVRTKDFAGHMVEWGSVNNPPYAVIRRAVRAVGLRLDESPRP